MPVRKKTLLDAAVEKKIESIKQTANDLLESDDCQEGIQSLLDQIKDPDEKIAHAVHRALTRVFCQWLQFNKILDGSDRCKLYTKAKEQLVKILQTSDSIPTMVLCLENLMKLLEKEGKYPFYQTGPVNFPGEFLKSILSVFLRDDVELDLIVTKYQQFIAYDDVKYFTLRFLLEQLKERREKRESLSDTLIYNVYCLLTSIRYPILGKKLKKAKTEQPPPGTIYCEPFDTNIPKFEYDYEKSARVFASTWLAFLSFKLPRPLYRKILILMDNYIMPHFHNPLTLSDFLINSFDVGGSTSLLALSSLFILIQKCGLEYPDFYAKLYSLLEPNILYVKYRARFFFWADIFLSSTHLPEYVVGAFVKRLSRMCLLAPVDALLIMVPFIVNLLIRHPNLAFLVNKSNQGVVESDPYDEREADLTKCHALESSLWELKTLVNHWHPKVGKAASFIHKPLPSNEIDLSEILESNFDVMLTEEFSKELSVARLDQAQLKQVCNFWRTGSVENHEINT